MEDAGPIAAFFIYIEFSGKRFMRKTHISCTSIYA